ncbi:PepSY-associated TM helix domain-containing protein [Bacteroidota bacterium]
MEFKWRKWNRATHRDLGYFFVGMIIIYSISGIAINHNEDWNPNYIITVEDFETAPVLKENIDRDYVKFILASIGEEEQYKNHYFPRADLMKIFIKGGIVVVHLDSGLATIEKSTKRPFFNEINFLHYDPGKWWTLFSDIFAVALTFLAISGLFILKGRNGIKWRGTILMVAGIIIPIIFLIFFR